MINQLSKENIEQNLRDAGCDIHSIEEFMNCRENYSVQKQILFLKCQKCGLLEKLHEAQKNIDCLDYLIYMIKKESDCNGK